MLPVPPIKSELKREVRFVGICADAVKLGVSREHLYRVLTGQRESQSLLKRYRELKAKLDALPHVQPVLPKPPATTLAVKPASQSVPARIDAAPRGLQKFNLNQKGKQ